MKGPGIVAEEDIDYLLFDTGIVQDLPVVHGTNSEGDMHLQDKSLWAEDKSLWEEDKSLWEGTNLEEDMNLLDYRSSRRRSEDLDMDLEGIVDSTENSGPYLRECCEQRSCEKC
jgi:hypothetical protein